VWGAQGRGFLNFPEAYSPREKKRTKIKGEEAEGALKRARWRSGQGWMKARDKNEEHEGEGA